MLKALLKIRMLQMLRIAAEMGVFRICVLLVLVALGMLFIFSQAALNPNALYVALAVLIIIFFIHIRRSDKEFLQLVSDRSYRLLLCEYLLLSTPVLAVLLFNGQWQTAILYLAALLLVPLVNFRVRHRNVNTWLQRQIPSACFEWKSGVRRRLWLLVIVWLVGLLLSPLTGSVPVAMLLLFLFTSDFYDESEPLDFVLSQEKGAKAFLYQKMMMQMRLFMFVAAPLLLAFVIFHPELWYVPCAQLLLSLVAFAYIICAKYAYYTPNEGSGGSKLLVAFGVIGSFIPFLLPVVVIMIFLLYRKACANLNFYLDDYNQ